MAKVQIDIEAKDMASGVIGEITDALKKNVSGWDLVKVAATAAGVAMAAFVKDSIKEFSEYTEVVSDFARVTGTTADESSRLIQIADDVRISFDTLKVAAKEAAKDGISLTVDELKKLSEQYLSIEDPAKRAKFLLDTFGKSGLEMGKLLEKGADGIDALNEGINENLVLTQEAIDAADEYKRNIDNINDSYKGLQIQIGNETIPVLNTLLNLFTRTNETIASGEQTYSRAALYTSALAIQEENLTNRINDAATARWDGIAALYKTNEVTAESAEISAEAAKAASQYYTSILSQSEKAFTDQQRYNEQLAETVAKYGEGSAEVQALQAAHAQALAQMQYDLLLAKLSVDGLTEAEFAMANQLGVTFGIFDQETAEATMLQNELTNAVLAGRVSADEYGAAIKRAMSDGVVTAGELRGIIASIPTEKTITLNVRSNISPQAQMAMTQWSAGEKGIPGRAEGGFVGANRPFVVGERGPELFVPSGNGNIVPNGAMGGGGTNITLVYSPAVSTASMTEVESVLLPIINNAVRRGYKGGQLG